MNVDYYLVSASRRAHRLRPGRNYVFGREEGVDIVLQDALVSRRHAETRWNEDHWLIADLNSRNGVMLNGARLTAPVKLNDGDQVQVGGQVFRMYLLPPGGDPTSLSNQAPQISNQETMAPGISFDALRKASATFTGVVSEGGVMELIQFFQVTGKSGRLDLGNDDNSNGASVWLVKGNPVHAICGDLTSIDALVELALHPPRSFSFHADSMPSGEVSISGSAQGVMMEVARQLDEASR
jgi:hypothetical protein